MSHWNNGRLAASSNISGQATDVEDRADSHPPNVIYDSFEPFFSRHQPNLFGYLWRVTGDEQAASDLCQETFLRAWQHFPKISGYERPSAWLFRVATNLALNYLRVPPVQIAPLPIESLETSAADLALAVVESDAVRRAVMALSPRQRAALVLREVYGFSCEEIAQVLRISHGAAKTILWRSRDAFREQYAREGGDQL